ncbi:Myosin regulatory light polypeptide 9 [Sarcoptes scabiei]|uniref:EF-hand domain containing protein 3 n=1 Tax=Sarcoptes scabiei TaxID=52283 RepID=A0A132AHP7_SARSC|nr:Myosin regulatory light polypeptide 9 [Sarcoptes scabiei]KPM10514.1 EF-hand domain containing protein 3 [Sarcoptes scabiei]UXI19756.1 protein Skeletor isoforms D/E-like [Sarcoptes scabiei]
MSAKTSSAKKRATRTTSNIFAMFSQNQIAEFKEAFTFIDQDKDGLISKADLRTTFDALGRMYPDDQLQGMLNEAPGPLNFTMFLSIFGERIAGGDNPDIIRSAFKTFDNDETGMVNAEDLRKMLTKFGEKLTDEEMDLALAEARMDSKGRFNIDSFIKLITGSEQEEDG